MCAVTLQRETVQNSALLIALRFTFSVWSSNIKRIWDKIHVLPGSFTHKTYWFMLEGVFTHYSQGGPGSIAGWNFNSVAFLVGLFPLHTVLCQADQRPPDSGSRRQERVSRRKKYKDGEEEDFSHFHQLKLSFTQDRSALAPLHTFGTLLCLHCFHSSNNVHRGSLGDKTTKWTRVCLFTGSFSHLPHLVRLNCTRVRLGKSDCGNHTWPHTNSAPTKRTETSL